MQALQLHYTSCRKGLLGSAGFQIRTCTPGIQAEDQRETVSQSRYQPPKNANSSPSYEEIQRDFPRAFRFYVLKSNRWAITMSSYAGQDYSGRWGNLFAHTLIADEGQLSMWPIDYYEWEGWKTFLPLEEDTDEIPPPLEPVNLSKIQPAESFSFPELQTFLLEAPGRKALLTEMIRAIFLSPKDSRAVVIRDSHLNGLFWIACLQKAFPLACATRLPFSTYQYSARNCALLNATTKDTDFLFNDTERNFQFYMFDLTTGSHSEVAEAIADYADYVAEWMANNTEQLSKFHQFMTRFHQYPLDDTILLLALKLFSIFTDNKPVLTDAELAGAIDFGVRFVSPNGSEPMIEFWHRTIEKLGSQIQIQDFEKIIQFLAEASAKTDKAAHQEITFRSWIQMFDRFIAEERYDQIGQVSSACRSIRSHLSAYERGLAERFVQPSHLNCLKEGIRKAPTDVLQFIYEEVFAALRTLGRVPLWTQREVIVLIRTLPAFPSELLTKLTHLFQAVGEDAQTLAEICKLAALNIKSEPQQEPEKPIHAGCALADVLKDKELAFASTVRKHLQNSMHYDILFGEWIQILESEPDKHAAYDNYSAAISGQLPRYWKAYEAQILDVYFNALSKKEQEECVSTWTKDGKILNFPYPFACRCLQMANQSLSLSTRSKQSVDMAERIEKLSRKLNYPLQPDRPFLRQLMLDARNNQIAFDDIPFEKLGAALTDLNQDDYGLFLSTFLEYALKRSKVGDQQQKVVEVVFINKHARVFKANYIAFVKRLKLKNEWKFAVYGLVCWIKISDAEEDAALSALWQDLEDVFVNVFRKIDKKRLLAIDRLLRYDKVGEKGFNAWETFQKEVTAPKKLIRSRLFRPRKR